MKTFSPFPTTNTSILNYSGVLGLNLKNGEILEALLRDPGKNSSGHQITAFTSLSNITLEIFCTQEWTIQVWEDRGTKKEHLIYQIPEENIQRSEGYIAHEYTKAVNLAQSVHELVSTEPPKSTLLVPDALVYISSLIAPSWHYIQDSQHITIFRPSIAQPPEHTYLSLWRPEAMVESYALYRNKKGEYFIVAHGNLDENSIFKPLKDFEGDEKMADIFGWNLDLRLLAKHLRTIFETL